MTKHKQRSERKKTTHLKKYIDKHVEIENKVSLHRYRGIYGTSVQPGCFCLWFDNDNSETGRILTKSKWRVIGVVEKENK